MSKHSIILCTGILFWTWDAKEIPSDCELKEGEGELSLEETRMKKRNRSLVKEISQ